VKATAVLESRGWTRLKSSVRVWLETVTGMIDQLLSEKPQENLCINLQELNAHLDHK